MLGEVFPKDGPRSLMSAAEVAVYEALRAQLPAGWRAWHSLRVRVGTRREGEGDFVIAAPDRGVLILEVKGGRIELTGGRWLQNGKEMPKPPRHQALGFAETLRQAVRARGAEMPPFGVACAFADVDFSAGSGPTAGDVAGAVIGHRDLPWLGRILPELVERVVRAEPMPRSARWLDVLHDLWGETWVPRVQLADRVEDAARRLLALDQEQLAILDFTGETPRALVDGGAGTGKTVVARELCARTARAGQRALYLCFTEALARSVDASLESERRAGGVANASTVRRYALDLVTGGNPTGTAPTPRDDATWHDVLVEACDRLPPNDARPDLVVIDEAQDLGDEEWLLVQALAEGRRLWAFRDDTQRFWVDRSFPEAMFEGAARLSLRCQRRNPAAIQAFAALYAQPVPHAPLPPPPSVGDRPALRVSVARDGDLPNRVRHELDVLRREGARAEDIVIISLMGQDRSRIVALPRLGTHALARADAAEATRCTVADTFLRFKGLERPIVIVTELIHDERARYDTRMHIAITRATAAAVIVCTEESLALDPRLGALPSG